MLRLLFFSLTLALIFTACQPGAPSATVVPEQDPAPATAPPEASAKVIDPAAAEILNRAYEAHGGDRYQNANYGFTFREKDFIFVTDDGYPLLSSTYEKDGKKYRDHIGREGFVRFIDNERQELTEKEYNSGFESLNSVIYFATLPFKLYDPAVNLYASGTTTIKENTYDVLKVNFDEEGGGVDHDDNFMYWVNQKTNRIDYLAYDYKTNKGGVRFRSAYNPRVVAGVLFQDYINYKAPLGTSLADLPGMFEKGTLEELSTIATENVVHLD